MVLQTLTSGNGFLTSFNTTIPRLYITAETDTVEEFDQITLKHWRDEGFDVIYLPYGNGGKAYVKELESIKDSMSLGDSFGIIGMPLSTPRKSEKSSFDSGPQPSATPQPSVSKPSASRPRDSSRLWHTTHPRSRTRTTPSLSA